MAVLSCRMTPNASKLACPVSPYLGYPGIQHRRLVQRRYRHPEGQSKKDTPGLPLQVKKLNPEKGKRPV